LSLEAKDTKQAPGRVVLICTMAVLNIESRRMNEHV
jgi:hypothetical protein